jgi:hypothetical protein
MGTIKKKVDPHKIQRLVTNAMLERNIRKKNRKYVNKNIRCNILVVG